MTENGVGELLDFMPPTGREVTDNHRLVRLVRCVRGRIRFEVDIAPRFDYGRQEHETHVTEHGVVFITPALTLTLHTVRDPGDARLATVSRTRQRRRARRLRAARPASSGARPGVREPVGPPRDIPNAEFDRLLDETSDFWRGWLAQSTLHRPLAGDPASVRGHAQADDLRCPPAPLVAAPTAGLPEQVGGERNWDYRYTWVRDGSFSVYALLGHGLHRGGGGVRRLASGPDRGAGRGRRAARSTSCTGSTAPPT